MADDENIDLDYGDVDFSFHDVVGEHNGRDVGE